MKVIKDKIFSYSLWDCLNGPDLLQRPARNPKWEWECFIVDSKWKQSKTMIFLLSDKTNQRFLLPSHSSPVTRLWFSFLLNTRGSRVLIYNTCLVIWEKF